MKGFQKSKKKYQYGYWGGDGVGRVVFVCVYECVSLCAFEC